MKAIEKYFNMIPRQENNFEIQLDSTFQFSVALTKISLAHLHAMNMSKAYILNLLLHGAHLEVISFEIVSDWKLTLTRLLRPIPLAHLTTNLPFSFAHEQNLVAPGNQTWVFPA